MKKLMMFKIAIVCFLFFGVGTIDLNAQINKGYLKIGTKLTAEISANEKHHYKIKLEKNEFAVFRIMQQGVDVVITTYDYNGKKIEDFDSPNGAYGTEIVTLTSTQKGEHLLEIQALGENTNVGKYELFVQRIKPKAVTPTEKVDELLLKYDSADAPGVALSVVKDGSVVYKKGVGIANLEYNIPITPSSIFHVASVSKQFTVFSILLLEKEGKLSLDDDIRKYLPELPDYGYKITLRNLANHTSGLREIFDLMGIIGIREDDLITNEQAFKIIKSQKELNFIPGSEYEYCNSGYILLAKIVEKVSGQKFAEFTFKRIFNPLKMTNTAFLDNSEKIFKNKAYSYSPDGDYYKKKLLNFSFVGSTGLNTTIEDLSLWAMNFEKVVIGDTDIFNKMKEQSTLNNGEKISYALGQEIKEYKGLSVIFHGGGDAGYRSYLLRIPAQNFSVVIMSNSEAFNPLDVAYKIVDYYLENKEISTDKSKNEKPINYQLLQTFTGDYEVLPGLIIMITKDENKLFLQAKGENQKTQLQPISENEFLVSGVNNRISFHKTNGQEIDLLKWHLFDFVYKGKRIFLKPFDENKVNLAEFTGKFDSQELGTEYNFIIRDNKLIATHNKNEEITLSSLQSDIFISNVGYFRKVEYLRNQNSQIIGCKISGSRTKDIKFEKVQ